MSDTSEEVYDVEKILDSRVVDGIKQYRIKWKGYSNRHNTWENEENVFAEDLIKEFEEKKLKKEGKYTITVDVKKPKRKRSKNSTTGSKKRKEDKPVGIDSKVDSTSENTLKSEDLPTDDDDVNEENDTNKDSKDKASTHQPVEISESKSSDDNSGSLEEGDLTNITDDKTDENTTKIIKKSASGACDDKQGDKCISETSYMRSASGDEESATSPSKKPIGSMVDEYVEKYMLLVKKDIRQYIKQIQDIIFDNNKYFVEVLYVDNTQGLIPYAIFRKEWPLMILDFFETQYNMEY